MCSQLIANGNTLNTTLQVNSSIILTVVDFIHQCPWPSMRRLRELELRYLSLVLFRRCINYKNNDVAKVVVILLL